MIQGSFKTLFHVTSERIIGRALKYGDNIATDEIISKQRMLSTSDLDELAKYAMEYMDPDFTKKVKKGSILVAGKNFGRGPSQEQAPQVLKHCGIRAIIADSFGRIFFRNSINIGLLVLECRGISSMVKEGDKLKIYPSTGEIENISRGITAQAIPLPDFALEIIRDGGLIPSIKRRRK